MFNQLQTIMATDLILEDQKKQFLELFRHEDIQGMSNDLLEGYIVAKEQNDIQRVDDYKKKIQDYFLLDKNLVHTKVVGHKDRFMLDIDAYIDNEDKEIYIQHHMPIKNIRIEKPIFLKDYKERIPAKIYKRIKEFKGIFEDKEIDYYVADVWNDPDPVFMIQLDGDRDKTFIIGAWE